MFILFSKQDNYISLEYKLPPILDLEILQRTIKFFAETWNSR